MDTQQHATQPTQHGLLGKLVQLGAMAISAFIALVKTVGGTVDKLDKSDMTFDAFGQMDGEPDVSLHEMVSRSGQGSGYIASDKY